MGRGAWRALVLTCLKSLSFSLGEAQTHKTHRGSICAMALEGHRAPTERFRPALAEGTSESNQGFTLQETAGYDSFIVPPMRKEENHHLLAWEQR